MLKFIRAGVVLLVAGAGVLLGSYLYSTRAQAQSPSQPAAKITAMTLAAVTATRMPSEITQRGAVAVQNNDAAVVWCGFTAAVTHAVASWQVPPNGGTWSVPYSYVQQGRGDVYCYSVAGTAAGAVRFLEAR